MNKYLKVIVFLLTISSTALGQSDEDLVKKNVDKATIESHIYFLASDELRGRATGSPEIDIAARYLATTLRSYGVNEVPGAPGYFQSVKMESVKPPTLVSFKLKDGGTDEVSDFVSLTSHNIQLESGLIFIGYGLEDDYKGKDVKGKIVIVKAGSADQQQARAMLQLSQNKRDLAVKMGASALIEFSTMEERGWKSMSNYFTGEKIGLVKEQKPSAIAHLWMRLKRNF